MAGYNTVEEMLRAIPKAWRTAEIAIGTSIGDAEPVLRVALHEDDKGRMVVVLYPDRLEVKDRK